jgi:putative heme iron utilization protein
MLAVGTVVRMTNPNLPDRVREAFQKNPKLMTPTMARELGVPERDIVRHLPEGRSKELDGKRSAELIQAFEQVGKVFVIVSNGAVVVECHGQFGGFTTTGPMLNVRTDTLDMHITTSRLETAFAVRKPGHMDGVETVSFQFFTPEGTAALKVFLTFGGQPPNPATEAHFAELAKRFEK